MLSKLSGKLLLAGGAVSVGTIATLSTARCSNEKSVAQEKDKRNQRILIVGGGTAGIGVAAMCRNEGMQNVTVVEPKSVHYYQPLWTLVGGGIKSNKDSVKDMKTLIPKGANWVQKSVQSFDPDKNQVTLEDGSSVDYDYLVVAAGIQTDWNKIPGLIDGLEQEGSGVVSVYDYKYSEKTWKEFQSIKEKASTMLFTMPSTPIKCAGAPQKILWILDDTLRSLGLRDNTSIQFWVPGKAMFGVKHYSDKLDVLRQERGIEAVFRHELLSLDVDKKVATFKNLDGVEGNMLVEKKYDFIHVTPPMSPPDFIRGSKLANTAGWVDVDKHTLQSTKYQNVFGLGDCTNTPNSKTAAAITSQAPVVVHNIARAIEDKKLDGKYSGYASCPLVIGRNKCILAEFGYGGKLMETFGRETGKFPLSLVGTEGALQQRFFFFLKQQLFPYVYWNLWVHGWWYGTNGPLKPDVVGKEDISKK